MKRERLRYQAVISIYQPTPERIREVFPEIHKYFNEISNKEWKMAYASPDGATAILVYKSHFSARKVVGDLISWSDNPPPGATILRTGDSILITEIGEDFSGSGFSNAWTWLQHH